MKGIFYNLLRSQPRKLLLSVWNCIRSIIQIRIESFYFRTFRMDLEISF